MRPHLLKSTVLIVGIAAALQACSRDPGNAAVRQTQFPGQVTAGGGTSGEVIARAGKPVADGSYAGGTPGIAGGSGGTTGGAATAGTAQESGHGPSGNTAPPAAKASGNGQ
jgi:hypothetical protein